MRFLLPPWHSRMAGIQNQRLALILLSNELRRLCDCVRPCRGRSLCLGCHNWVCIRECKSKHFFSVTFFFACVLFYKLPSYDIEHWMGGTQTEVCSLASYVNLPACPSTSARAPTCSGKWARVRGDIHFPGFLKHWPGTLTIVQFVFKL